MAVLTAQYVATLWTMAGGPSSRAVEWVAIAMGESSLDDQVVSSAGAIGLWQIMPFNAAVGGGSVQDLYNPLYNASVAVRMSGGGTNCAAWDSCYADIYRSGRYSYLSYPEHGSADYNNIPIAAAMIGVDALQSVQPEPSTGVTGDLTRGAAAVQQLVQRGFPQLRSDTLTQQAVIGALYQPGWRGWMFSGR